MTFIQLVLIGLNTLTFGLICVLWKKYRKSIPMLSKSVLCLFQYFSGKKISGQSFPLISVYNNTLFDKNFQVMRKKVHKKGTLFLNIWYKAILWGNIIFMKEPLLSDKFYYGFSYLTGSPTILKSNFEKKHAVDMGEKQITIVFCIRMNAMKMQLLPNPCVLPIYQFMSIQIQVLH